MKIVICKKHGGYGLSKEAIEWLVSKGIDCDPYVNDPLERNDPLLIQMLKELGSKKASGPYAKLGIVEIPDDVDWDIRDYDGKEWVVEQHRSWGRYD